MDIKYVRILFCSIRGNYAHVESSSTALYSLWRHGYVASVQSTTAVNPPLCFITYLSFFVILYHLSPAPLGTPVICPVVPLATLHVAHATLYLLESCNDVIHWHIFFFQHCIIVPYLSMLYLSSVLKWYIACHDYVSITTTDNSCESVTFFYSPTCTSVHYHLSRSKVYIIITHRCSIVSSTHAAISFISIDIITFHSNPTMCYIPLKILLVIYIMLAY